MSGRPELRSQRRRTRLLVGLAVAAGFLVFAIANAHLIHVAFTSQPDCVPHAKTSGSDSGAYRAAKSAC